MARDFLSANENTRRTDTIGFVMMWTGFAAFLISIFRFPTLHIACLALVPVGFLVILAGKVVHLAKTLLRPSYDEVELMKRHAGMRTEREVAAVLNNLKRRGYRVMHNLDVMASGTKAQIDHIVIGPNGVFHIETKGWSGNIRFQNGQVIRDEGKHTENPTGQVRHHEIVMKRMLRTNGFKSIPLHGILCFGSENARLSGESRRYATVQLGTLNQRILQWRTLRTLTSRQAKQIYRVIQRHSQESTFTSISEETAGFRNHRHALRSKAVPFVKMSLRPDNWFYSVIGIVISLVIIFAAALVS